MFRIEYEAPTANGVVKRVIFADNGDEAMELLAKCTEYDYNIVRVNDFNEE